MNAHSDPARSPVWPASIRLLHWFMAAALLLQWFAGEFDDAFGGSGFHVSLGLTLFALLLLRLALRLLLPSPPPPATAPGWERLAARAMHWAWYALLLALPVTGLLYRDLRDRAVSWFGLFDLPGFMEANRELAHQMEELHEWLAWVAVALLVLHVLAALKHHFIDRDHVLKAMLGR